MSRATRRVGALVGLVMAVGYLTNPATGRRELAVVLESQEIEMGRQGAAAVTASIGLHPDAALRAYVNGIGQAPAARTDSHR